MAEDSSVIGAAFAQFPPTSVMRPTTPERVAEVAQRVEAMGYRVKLDESVGQVMVGFSTANRIPEKAGCLLLRCIHESQINKAFRAVAEATEEAVLRSMYYANATTGYSGKIRRSLSEFWQP